MCLLFSNIKTKTMVSLKCYNSTKVSNCLFDPGCTVCFIYGAYNFLYLKNQTKLTNKGNENSLLNIQALTVYYILL